MSTARDTISASDLRGCLLIGFQPAITARPEVLAQQIEHMGRTLAGVSERRIRNAAEATNLEVEILDALLAARLAQNV